ncbi:MAG: hypothetical protein RR290_04325, partial [Clostridia bacterium]
FIGICFVVIVCIIGIAIELEHYFVPSTIVGILFAFVSIVIALGSTSFFNFHKMQCQIEIVSEDSFVDNSQIPTVDNFLAMKQGKKELDRISSLSSQVTLKEFTIQEVNGKLVFVAPLEHKNFSKWKLNRSTSGYIVVSATDYSDVKLVEEINGKKIKLKYLKSACFEDDLVRYIRNNGYLTEGLTDFSFELDDTGKPFYVVTKYVNTILWGSQEATGTIICDVQTGEIADFSIENTPKWVDRIQPQTFITSQINNCEHFGHGIFNSTNKNKMKKISDMLIVYNKGNCYYYTGFNLVDSGQAIVGFIMVNTRTKEATKFSMNGVTEDAAMRSAESLVQDLEYTATKPILLNLNDIPTYFMTLKDNEGFIKQYAMVNIKNYSIVALGSTIIEAKIEYMNKMTSTGNNITFSNEVFSYNVTGEVTRISANVENGNTYYYIILNNDNNKLFIAPYTISKELPITKKGDTVDISYIDDSNMSIDVTKFDNIKFSQIKSEYQQVKDNHQMDVISDDNSKINEIDHEKDSKTWDSLTNEEKLRFWKNIVSSVK